ncbi:MAG: hypothetical protein ACREMJ_02590 [Gemmatimonadales bacterium]
MITRIRLLAIGLAGVLAAACGDPPRDPTGLAPSFRRGDGGEREPPQFSAWSAPVNLGPIVNSASQEVEVAISRDGLSLYFSSGRSGNFDLWVSQRASGDAPWGAPQNLGSTINTSAREQSPFLTPDGHRLYFMSDRPGGVGGLDLYVSRRRDKRDDFAWQPPENLGSGVNTSAGENVPVVFEDHATGTTTLYFTSNRDRPAGVPGDIYASTLQPDERFGPAVLVEDLSSPRRDRAEAIRRDGLEVFIGSDRPGPAPAPFDLWVATRDNTANAWSPPVNLGSVVNNSTANDTPGALSFDGTTLYLISDRPGTVGGLDIWVSTRTRLHRTVLVDPKRSGDGIAKTIQEGIGMVAPGGRVRVAPGTYAEALVINKGLTLEGIGGESGPAIIVPIGTPFATIEIATSDPVIIRGLTVHARPTGISGISALAEDVTIERTTVLAVDPPVGIGWLIDVVGDESTHRRARLVVRQSVLDGSISFERSQAPPFPQILGIRARGDIDAWLEGNVISRTGGACILVQTRLDLGGSLDVDIVRNVLDECHASRAGALIVGPPIMRNPPLPPVGATGTVNIVGNTIRNSHGSCLTTSAIYYELYTGKIEHNRIEGVVQECAAASDRVQPAGIWVGSLRGVPAATPAVRFNDIEGNTHAGLRLGPNMTTALDARCNWWGSASGPSSVGPGTGDAIIVETGAATPVFAPWATRPVAQRGHGGDRDDDDDDDGDDGGRAVSSSHCGPNP